MGLQASVTAATNDDEEREWKAPPRLASSQTVASVMADLVREQAPEEWTVEHIDDDSCPSQGWGTAPSGLRWYFRNRHGRWTFAVGQPNGDDSRYVPIDGAVWVFDGEGDMLLSDEIITIVLDCMRRVETAMAYVWESAP